jgi:hypothetical protein
MSQNPPRPAKLYRLDAQLVWPPSTNPQRQYAAMKPGEWSQHLQDLYDGGCFLVETDNPALDAKGVPDAIYGKPGFFGLAFI